MSILQASVRYYTWWLHVACHVEIFPCAGIHMQERFGSEMSRKSTVSHYIQYLLILGPRRKAVQFDVSSGSIPEPRAIADAAWKYNEIYLTPTNPVPTVTTLPTHSSESRFNMSVPEYQDTGPITIPESIAPTNLAGKSVIITGGMSFAHCAMSCLFLRENQAPAGLGERMRRLLSIMGMFVFLVVNARGVELIGFQGFRYYRRFEPGLWSKGC